MASYVESVLSKGEEVFYQGRLSLVKYWLNFVLAALLILPALKNIACLLIVILLICWPFLMRYSTELVITNKRVIAKFGIFSRNTIEINFKKIESLRVNQGIFGRMLNYGSIIVVGSGATHAPILNISSPLEFRRAYDTAAQHIEA
ncbi:PH domain-containing protein [Govanella unica]|uniref:PH domain-containing protein n=1 Tax=Govanella unica TaxID=2975056 RepID=A0A9X3TZG0_9PROT|nr:PH domain-containing protein [Govania unica]MDA5194811.1 PH domain-containing protein [Govania unica]